MTNSILIDTNVLLASRVVDHPKFEATVQALEGWATQSFRLVLAPQVIYEAYVVASRPQAVNGLGLNAAEAADMITAASQIFQVLDEPGGLWSRWLRICRELQISGKAAHDARLVAFAQVHGIPRMLTLDAATYSRHEGVEMLDV